MKDLDYYLQLDYDVEIIEIPLEEGGGYTAFIPELGKEVCIADGETIQEAVRNVLFLKNYLIKEWYRKGIPIPEPKGK